MAKIHFGGVSADATRQQTPTKEISLAEVVKRLDKERPNWTARYCGENPPPYELDRLAEYKSPPNVAVEVAADETGADPRLKAIGYHIIEGLQPRDAGFLTSR